jgi:hypothetical protein
MALTAMTYSDFDECRRAVRWAKDEISSIETSIGDFISSEPYERVIEPGTTMDEQIVLLRQTKDFPDSVRKSSHDIITYLRNALDYATSAASQAIGTENPKYTNFPFCEDRLKLEQQLRSIKGPYRGIPKKLHPKIMSFNPYWPTKKDKQGDGVLRSLGALANPNKHSIPLQLGIQTGGIGFTNLHGVNLHSDQIPGKRLSDTEFELFRFEVVEPVHHVEFDVEVFIFIAGETPAKGHEAIVVFKDLFEKVSTVISEIEAETLELLGS